MSEGNDADDLPASKTDIFKEASGTHNIHFSVNSALAILVVFSLMLYIVISSTKDDFATMGGNARVLDMVAEAKELDGSLNKSFLAVTTKALADKKVTSSEFNLIDAEYNKMLNERDMLIGQSIDTAQSE